MTQGVLSHDNAWPSLFESLHETDGVVSCFRLELATASVLEVFPSPFLTALVWDEILSCWCGDNLQESLHGAIDFLLSCEIPDSGWRFFLDGRGYPPDADDTSVVADLLYKCNALKDPPAIATLLNANRSPKGHSYVWLARDEDSRRNDAVDPYVDLNVKRCLLHLGSGVMDAAPFTLSALHGFPSLHKSAYYRDACVKIWLVSRLDRLYSTRHNDLEGFERECPNPDYS